MAAFGAGWFWWFWSYCLNLGLDRNLAMTRWHVKAWNLALYQPFGLIPCCSDDVAGAQFHHRPDDTQVQDLGFQDAQSSFFAFYQQCLSIIFSFFFWRSFHLSIPSHEDYVHYLSEDPNSRYCIDWNCSVADNSTYGRKKIITGWKTSSLVSDMVWAFKSS